MPPVADETLAQRAMIHLLLGEVQPARQLADGIELSRHQHAKTKAMMASVIAEAWARTGQAKKAAETLAVFSADDAELAELRPQILRAQAFAHASLNDAASMKKALHQMLKINPQLLAAFFVSKKTHPLLQREARAMLERSGAMPRQTVTRRMG